MERLTIRRFVAAARLIREPVLLVYTYPRNHPLYGEEVELGVFEPTPRKVEVAPGIRPCPACGAPLAEGETHWSIFPSPMGGYICPTEAAP